MSIIKPYVSTKMYENKIKVSAKRQQPLSQWEYKDSSCSNNCCSQGALLVLMTPFLGTPGITPTTFGICRSMSLTQWYVFNLTVVEWFFRFPSKPMVRQKLLKLLDFLKLWPQIDYIIVLHVSGLFGLHHPCLTSTILFRGLEDQKPSSLRECPIKSMTISPLAEDFVSRETVVELLEDTV